MNVFRSHDESGVDATVIFHLLDKGTEAQGGEEGIRGNTDAQSRGEWEGSAVRAAALAQPCADMSLKDKKHRVPRFLLSHAWSGAEVRAGVQANLESAAAALPPPPRPIF